MFDREMAQRALEKTTPEFRAMVHDAARQRGLPPCEIALETALVVAQEQAGEALYALKRGQESRRLRLV